MAWKVAALMLSHSVLELRSKLSNRPVMQTIPVAIVQLLIHSLGLRGGARSSFRSFHIFGGIRHRVLAQKNFDLSVLS
jgi:hypothetical protein